MNAKRTIVPAVLALAALLAAPAVRAQEEGRAAPQRPKVEVVFVLDTTGSMGGLIAGAKVKIWKIVNQIVSGKPVPDLRVGLVAYRDRKDAYVTKMTPLTADLDAVYGALKALQAQGGGDGPESVNEALHVALTKPDWSRDDRTLRIVYLVGDAPPHMDYDQDVKYPATCAAAARAAILINTVQCGANGATTKVWKDIADRAEGKFFRIDQGGGMATIETPFDARLAELSRELGASTVFYGDRDDRRKAKDALDDAEEELDEAPPEAAAERAGFLGKSVSGRGRTDLLARLESGDLKVADLKKEELPEDLAKLEPAELEKRIEELLAARKKLRAELVELDAKRAAFLKEEAEKRGEKGDAFDDKVVEALREQAKKVGIEYER